MIEGQSYIKYRAERSELYSGPNFDATSIRKASEVLEKNGIAPSIMVDCSHGNSNKDPLKQLAVFEDVTNQVLGGSDCFPT